MKEKNIGALQSVFPCSQSKILDHMLVMKDFDYSISDISRISKMGFKTTLESIHQLKEQNVFILTRTVGRSKMYRFNSKSSRGKSIERLAWDIAENRNTKMIHV